MAVPTLKEKLLENKVKQFEALVSFDTRLYCDCINLITDCQTEKARDYLARIQKKREELGYRPR